MNSAWLLASPFYIISPVKTWNFAQSTTNHVFKYLPCSRLSPPNNCSVGFYTPRPRGSLGQHCLWLHPWLAVDSPLFLWRLLVWPIVCSILKVVGLLCQ